MSFEIIKDMWNWYAMELIGQEVIAVIGLALLIFLTMGVIGVPKKLILVLMIPAILSMVLMGYIGWFGWLIIGFGGVAFGYFVYKLYG